MTLISDYTSLQTASIEYLARDQDTTLIARVPTFVQFFEAKMNRTLFVRQMENRETSAIDMTSTEPEFVSLPSDFQSMRRLRITTITGKPRLQYLSSAALDEFRYGHGNTPGRPRYFTIHNDEMEFAPTPDQTYGLEMVYRSVIPPLATNTTNWLLTLAPDLYLYGVLMESAPYIKEDARLQTWGSGFKTALDDLNTLGLTSTFNAGPLEVRVSGLTP